MASDYCPSCDEAIYLVGFGPTNCDCCGASLMYVQGDIHQEDQIIDLDACPPPSSGAASIESKAPDGMN